MKEAGSALKPSGLTGTTGAPGCSVPWGVEEAGGVEDSLSVEPDPAPGGAGEGTCLLRPKRLGDPPLPSEQALPSGADTATGFWVRPAIRGVA